MEIREIEKKMRELKNAGVGAYQMSTKKERAGLIFLTVGLMVLSSAFTKWFFC